PAAPRTPGAPAAGSSSRPTRPAPAAWPPTAPRAAPPPCARPGPASRPSAAPAALSDIELPETRIAAAVCCSAWLALVEPPVWAHKVSAIQRNLLHAAPLLPPAEIRANDQATVGDRNHLDREAQGALALGVCLGRSPNVQAQHWSFLA